MKVGKPIEVGLAVTKAAGIISKNPLMLLPQYILLVPTLLGDFSGPPVLDPLKLVVYLLWGVFAVIVAGAYPLMVKTVFDGGKLSLPDALGKAFHRFWTLLAAGILVVLICVLGTVALVVPGIIFVTWYVYTIPALMLDGKGALGGMQASRDFGRDKKWSTFLILLTFAAAATGIEIVELTLFLVSHPLGQVVSSVLEAPLDAWASVVFSYVYLTCGPSSVPAASEGQVLSAAPPPMQQQTPQAGVSDRFCTSCGATIKAGSRFCGSCGQPV